MKDSIRTGLIMKRQISRLMIIAALCLVDGSLFSQSNQYKYSRQTAVEAFSKGDYEQAYNEFGGLLLTFSKDPLYKYYSGICLVKLERDPDKAAALLLQSIEGAAAVKPVPSDAWFYLGRAQQMNGNFADALKSYKLFVDHSGKKVAAGYDISVYIQQCNEKRGQIRKDEPRLAENVIKSAVDLKTDDKNRTTDKVTKTQESPVEVRKERLPADYEKILAEAIIYQVKADSLNAIVSEDKKALERLPDAGKVSLRSKIARNESLAASYQKIADQKYSVAQSAVTGQPIPLPVVEKESDLISDSSTRKPESSASKATDQKQPIPAVSVKTDEVYSIFNINPKPVYSPDEKITIDPELPGGLVYQIQVAVFRNPVTPSLFKGITPINGFKMAATGTTKYYAGLFRRLDDARKALEAVKQTSFKDAFIVAVFDGKTVSAERALLLENEWKDKPFTVTPKPVPVIPAETVSPTLSFRVEVTRSEKPLKEDLVDNYKKLAMNRGFEIVTTGDNKLVYLIGKFITFESASEYADLLVRNGYREAKVTAWLGRKEIPVETARQLFEKLE